jgi:hypothetical protein
VRHLNLLLRVQQLKWLLFVGPYFAEMELGPFSDAELQTRRHKPNTSGDVVELLIARAEKRAPPVQVPLYFLGTVEGATNLKPMFPKRAAC